MADVTERRAGRSRARSGRKTRRDVDAASRPGRPAAGPAVHVDIDEAIRRLKTERPSTDGDRNAITLTKYGGLTLVLTALRRGAVLREHRARPPRGPYTCCPGGWCCEPVSKPSRSRLGTSSPWRPASRMQPARWRTPCFS